MTRVAAIYDIHGNLPALEAVLEEISRERVDRIVVGADVTLGPMPREVLKRLLDRNPRLWRSFPRSKSENARPLSAARVDS